MELKLHALVYQERVNLYIINLLQFRMKQCCIQVVILINSSLVNQICKAKYNVIKSLIDLIHRNFGMNRIDECQIISRCLKGFKNPISPHEISKVIVVFEISCPIHLPTAHPVLRISRKKGYFFHFCGKRVCALRVSNQAAAFGRRARGRDAGNFFEGCRVGRFHARLP